ncbi:hypothetical protein GOP47_0021563 [Adiantum capillus-veneris]|uniref:Uncharacterized protein n=1 Tax=Adiantum capillus-veneris TaxID=13818 RepID=A0A9D4U9V4_ADICA|nr:hypothetical protein GOP47_0021563 [Adiantum capillus-veneris]
MAVPVSIEEEDDDFEEEQTFNRPSDLNNLLTAAELGNAHELSQALGQLSVSVNDAAEDGDTALHLACLYGHTHCVQILLEAGASIDVKDEDGAIPLHDACAGGYVEIVKALLTAAQGDEQKVKRLLETTDIDGDTPLHHAARGNHGVVVEVLLSYGASPSPRNYQGKTAAELADDANVQKLLEAAVC